MHIHEQNINFINIRWVNVEYTETDGKYGNMYIILLTVFENLKRYFIFFL